MKTRSFIVGGVAVHRRTITTPRPLIFRRAWLWTGLLVLATIVLGARPAQAAVTEAWVQRSSTIVSNRTDEGVKVVRDAAGDIIVTGVTGAFRAADFIREADMLTIKYSGADGSVLWQQRYNGPANGIITPRAIALGVDGSGNVVVTGRSASDWDSDEGETYTARCAAADGALLWERRDPDILPTSPYPASLAVDGNGNVVVTGTSHGANSGHDFYTAKYAATDGALLWEKRYNGPANGFDEAHAVALDGSGNVVVTGTTWGTNSGYDYYTAKYAATDGALLWEKRYAGPGYSEDQPSALALDGSGNVVVTGTSYTVKYAAADGALLWEKRYTPPANGFDENPSPHAVAVDGSGNVVVTGTTWGANSRNDYYTAKYAAADGALLWEKSYNGPANSDDSASAMAVDGSGNVVVTGSSDNGSNFDCYTAKYAAADGALLWEKRYNGPANSYDYANAVAVDGNGNVVMIGRTDAVISMGSLRGDYYTAKYAAADGTLLWEKRYDGTAPGGSSAQAVAVDGSGNVVVTGSSHLTDSGSDYYTAKYAAANGALLWEKRYNGTSNSGDYANAVAIDGSGNVVVTGYSGGDYYTAKYAAADGVLLWENRYGGPGNSGAGASAVAADGSGNVVVTGESINGSHYNSYTAKYAAANGALLWEKRYGPANGDAFAGAVAADGIGNVVITGSTSSNNSGYDYYTAKYAATDGALLWERRYNGPANSDDSANAVAVDAGGNVVVTGISSGTNSDRDYYTVKYAAADGALLWEKRYNGPANGYDQASAVSVDGSGNVVVTGYSDNGMNYDYYTAKYAAVDGALLWEKRYNGPANRDDLANAVVIDGSGNVVVTGTSSTSVDPFLGPIGDYYTAKYGAADGALLWERRFTGPDSISSALALGPDGMVAVTGTANGGYATVVYREVSAVSIDLISTGVRLHVTGLPGRPYNIERAPAVTGPWSTINTQTAPASGLFEYLDTNPPAAAAFYRTSQP